MAFKQSFKYLKNEKITFIKVILKLECLFFQNIYVLFFIFYIHRAISTQTNPKSDLGEKKFAKWLLLYFAFLRKETIF